MNDKKTLLREALLGGPRNTPSKSYLGSLARQGLLDYGESRLKKPLALRDIASDFYEKPKIPLSPGLLGASLDLMKRSSPKPSLAAVGGALRKSTGPLSQYVSSNMKYSPLPSLRETAMMRSLLQHKPAKRKVFISYHHKNDQAWYDLFTKHFGEYLDIFYDNSLDRKIDSTKSEYLDRKIREQYIRGSSVTIVLCGPETWKRRWIDWEIFATLYRKHGVLGIGLPTCSKLYDGKFTVSERLHYNVVSGYAVFMEWTLDPDILTSNIELAVTRSKNCQSLIRNSTNKMKRSLS